MIRQAAEQTPADEPTAEDSTPPALSVLPAFDKKLDLTPGESREAIDTVHLYLKAIGERKLLSAEDEVRLAKRIERADNEAKNIMIEANLRLVVSIAKRYNDRGVSLLDLIQEGNVGLMRAVEKFDWRRGYKFQLTRRGGSVRESPARSQTKPARFVFLVHLLQNVNKVAAVRRRLVQELGREPSIEEVAKEVDMEEADVKKLMELSADAISLETPMGSDEGAGTIGDMVEDDSEQAPEEIVAERLLSRRRH